MSDTNVEKKLIVLTKQLLQESGEQFHREIRLTSSLQKHLGIDSLARAELFQRIEKQFSVTVPDQLLAEAETLQDIATFLESAPARQTHHEKPAIMTSHGARSSVDPTHAHSLIDILLMYAEHSPDKAHIYFQNELGGEDVLTYGQLLHFSLRVASGLIANGLREGETVAIMQPTGFNFFYIFLGTLLAGGIPVPIYPPFRAHMLEAYARTEARILTNAGVRMLVTFDQAETLSRLLQGFVPSLKLVTTVDALLKYDEIRTPFKANADHFAFIQYTSGSTNDPKGVLLSHRNLLANISAYGRTIKVTPEDVAVSWLPLYHDFGLIGAWLGSFYHGIPLVLLTPFTFLNHPERWLWAFHYHRGTLSGGPNFAYDLCVRKIDSSKLEGLDLSAVRVLANGAEKVYPNTLQQFTTKFAKYGLKRGAMMPVYGLAESTVCLAIPPLGRDFRLDHIERKAFEENKIARPTTADDKSALMYAACGVALPDHAIRVVDEIGNVLPERHIGSIEFRGPSSMQGYYNNQAATQAIYHDGWINSGDLGYLADEEIFITGRRKDLIIKAGRNLYPAEIEELVGAITGVRQGCVAAFAVTDEKRATEQLIVVAETRDKNTKQHEDIKQEINNVIATALDMVPDHIVLVAPRIIPKTSSGKLQRAACKKMYLEGRLNRWQLPAWLQVVKLSADWCWQKVMKNIKLVGRFIFTVYVAIVLLLTFFPVYFSMLATPPKVATKICKNWFKFLLIMMCCRVKCIGKDNLTKAKPMIYAANHASYMDFVVALTLLPPDTRFVGKKELLSAPVLGTFMKKLNYIVVDRKDMSKGIENTKAMIDCLQQGHSIFIFPEGTFGFAQGLRPFRMGAFKIAAETHVPVCPVGLQGTRRMLRAEEILMSPGFITVTVSEPILPMGTEWQEVTQLRQLVRAEIAKHCGEASLDFIAAQVVADRAEKFTE